MSLRPMHLAIDARPRGPRGLIAAEVVLGRSMLGHVLELATELASEGNPVQVHARPEDQRELRELAGDRFGSGVVFFERLAAGGRGGPADRPLLR